MEWKVHSIKPARANSPYEEAGAYIVLVAFLSIDY